MSDHDQRFKIVLQTFFAEFFRLFFPAWAERFDFSQIEWLDKEVFPEPPQGKRRFLDLVAKVATRQIVPGQRPGEKDSWIALIHVEIEHEEAVAPLRPRVFHYYQHLRDRHGLPALPIGLYLRVGLEGVGIDIYEERFWDLRPVHFEYLYVALPALDAVKYVEGENWLGVALSALMRIPKGQEAWLGAEALRRLRDAPLTGQQRFYLAECVQAYLSLDAAQQEQFEQLLTSEPYEGVRGMRATWFEQGEAKGEARGLEQGQRKILALQLEEQFGPLKPQARERFEALSAEKLSDLARRLLRAKSLQELGLED
jgi:Domain of unknown function (DUF4351)